MLLAFAAAVALLFGADPPGAVTGTVTLGGIAAPGAVVRITPVETWSTTLARTTTAADGTFTLDPIDDGQYVVEATLIGVTERRPVTVRNGISRRLAIEIGRGCDNVPEPVVAPTDINVSDALTAIVDRADIGGREMPLLADGLPAEFVGRMSGKFRLVTAEALRREANSSGEMPYVQIDSLRAMEGCVAATVSQSIAIPESEVGRVLLGGVTLRVEARQVHGQWITAILHRMQR